ncbi:hypothetical protein [Thiolapillus sp.]
MKYRNELVILITLFMSLFVLVACSGEDDNMKPVVPPLPTLTDAQVKALSGKTFYFAHQSVGYNIVDGVEKVLEKLGYPGLFKVKELKPGEPVPEDGLLHSTIGKNGDPESKMSEFQAYLDERLGSTKPDMAMLKFCYVDIGKDTDVSALVDEYSQTMSKLDERHPETVFLHTTVPLRVFNSGWKASIKRLLGMEVWGDQANIKRNEYNALVRKKYAGTGHLADIADWESRFPDGREYRVEVLGGRYAALIPAYTDDGRHLNAYGQQIVAGRLLEFLAGLAIEKRQEVKRREMN